MSKQDHILLTGLKVSCIIGIFDWERERKQPVLIDLKFPANIRRAARRDRIEDTVNYKKIAKAVIAFVEKSSYQLIETLAENLADLILDRFQLPEIFIRVSKPGAVRGSQNVGVEITRKRAAQGDGLAYFSLGSNLHPEYHLKNALREMDLKFGIRDLSRVYETSPVGGRKGQPFFWNMVLSAGAEESPATIRQWTAALEKREGRVKTRNRFGSRTLDVDLILWNNLSMQGRGFQLPHPDILTKAFVLFPLLEIAPNLRLSGGQRPLIEIAQSFRDKTQLIRQLPEGTIGL